MGSFTDFNTQILKISLFNECNKNLKINKNRKILIANMIKQYYSLIYAGCIEINNSSSEISIVDG